MIMRARLITVVVVLLLMDSGRAIEIETGRSAGLGAAVLLSESSAAVLLSIPSSGIEPGEGKVELIATRHFELKDLDRLSVTGAYRYHSFTVAAGFDQYGYRDFYAERTAKVGVAMAYRQFSFGLNLSGMLVDFGPGKYGQLRASSVGIGTAVRTKKFFGAIVMDNLNSPTLYEGGPVIRPYYSFYFEFARSGSFSTVSRMTLEDTEKPQLALGQFFRVSRKASLFWGFSTKPTKFGGGVEVDIRQGAITYATNFHSTLGFTHQVSLSYHFNGKKQEEEKVF